MIQQQTVYLRGMLLVFLTTAWISGILLSSLLLFPLPVLLVLSTLALLTLPFCWHQQRYRLFLGLTLCALLGALRYTIVLPANDPSALTHFIGPGTVTLKGSVVDPPRLQGHSRVLVISVEQIQSSRTRSWQSVHGEVQVQSRGLLVEDPYGANYGDSVEVRGILRPPSLYSSHSVQALMLFPRITPQETSGNPLFLSLYHFRLTLAAVLAQILPEPAAAVLIGIVLGLRTPALQPLSPLFNTTGTTHLLVSSGFNVTILAATITSIATFLKSLRRTQPLHQLPAEKRRDWHLWLETLLIIVTIALYTILSGAGTASIRAGMMGTLMALAPRANRVYNVHTALAFSTLLMSIYDPFVLWDIGFQLSFLGTLGIVQLTPLLHTALQPLGRLPAGALLQEHLATTLAAQLTTWPIIALSFQQVSLIAPLANMLTVPLVSLLIVAGMLTCLVGYLWLPLALLCGWLLWPPLWYMQHALQWCMSLPAASLTFSMLDVPLTWLYYALLALSTFLLLTYWPQGSSPPTKTSSSHQQKKPPWLVIMSGVALSIVVVTGVLAHLAPTPSALTITIFALTPPGKSIQGEAILIRTSAGKTILIDGGVDAVALAQQLDSHLPSWQRSLDAVIVTSTRQDHLAATLDVIQRYSVGFIVDGGMLHPDATYALWRRTIDERGFQYIRAKQALTLPLGSQGQLRVLWPAKRLHKGSNEVRDNGLIIYLDTPGLHMLLLGESAYSKYALSGLLTSPSGSRLRADVVQIVGGRTTPFPALLSQLIHSVQPALVVVTPVAPPANSQKRALPPEHSLLSKSYQLLRIATTGSIELSTDRSGWTVHTN